MDYRLDFNIRLASDLIHLLSDLIHLFGEKGESCPKKGQSSPKKSEARLSFFGHVPQDVSKFEKKGEISAKNGNFGAELASLIWGGKR